MMDCFKCMSVGVLVFGFSLLKRCPFMGGWVIWTNLGN